MAEYKKYCYWMDLRGLERLKRDLEGKDFQLIQEEYIPCRILRKQLRIGLVSTSAWGGFCKRRTSWYWESEKANKFLVVSNTLLDFLGFGNPIMISESNFKPDWLPTPEELSKLTQSKEYQKRKPLQWDKPDSMEIDFSRRWFKRFSLNEPFDFDKLLLGHSANHANFLDPKYFITFNGMKVPYSIAQSIHVCSACLEFFNILGEQWPIKYVVPCIGAVQFARLPKDKYFEVRVCNDKDIDIKNDLPGHEVKMVCLELKPSLSSCIETLSKKEYEQTLSLLLKEGHAEEELGERLEVLRLFLESVDFGHLRSQYEGYLMEGRQVTFLIYPEAGKVSYKLVVE